MKTTDHASDPKHRALATTAPWYRVRPALLAALMVGVALWLTVLGYGAMTALGSHELLETAARLLGQYGGAVLNALAALAVVAVAVEALRTSDRLRHVRRKLITSLRANHGPHGSRTARA